ncbi:YkgJ family cysteine cluster protein [Burkholderia cenocepacia]|uniref:YkgJ family cysteine cluster protein n=1 Tax=Burkholderia cenocepacia TaxID=95486 RepID=UPI002AB11726|nr:YkgJ family cysteine cluster protein [Burkholderia cenocepacia]
MPLHFSCTMCGRCCRDLRVPLRLSEAVDWLRDGGEVQLLCEAIPWLIDPPADDLAATYKFRRSFAAVSGTLPLRITVTVAAAFDGPCPHLQPDLACGIYDRRPHVCRIYPAEINPFIELRPAGKACPPDAWADRHPLLEVSGRYVEPSLVASIEAFRDTDISDVGAKRMLCDALGICSAALTNEGFVVVSAEPEAMIRAITTAIDKAEAIESKASIESWTLISNRHRSREALALVDAHAAAPEALPDRHEYLGFHMSGED